MLYSVPVGDKLIFLTLYNYELELNEMPIYIIKNGLGLDIGELLAGWFPTGDTKEINPESPPYCAEAKDQLLKQGEPNIQLLTRLYAEAQSLGKVKQVKEAHYSFTIVDSGKLYNMLGEKEFKNRWAVLDKIPDELETIKQQYWRLYLKR